MRIDCDCGSTTFYLNFIPPLRLKVECTECGAEQEVGGEGGHRSTDSHPTDYSG